MEQRPKYIGKSLDWSLPNVCLGRFLNIVIPAMVEVQTTEPKNVPNSKTWRNKIPVLGRYSADLAARATTTVDARSLTHCLLAADGGSMSP